MSRPVRYKRDKRHIGSFPSCEDTSIYLNIINNTNRPVYAYTCLHCLGIYPNIERNQIKHRVLTYKKYSRYYYY